jgi:hypothetical protein
MMEQPASTTVVLGEQRLTYAALQQQVTRQSISRFLWKGMGGPLVFLGVVGAAVCLVVLSSTLLAMSWIAGVSVLGLVMVAFELGDQKVRAQALESVVARWFLAHAIPDLSLGKDLQTGTETFAQIALQIAEIEKRHGADPYLRWVLDRSRGLLMLQYQQGSKAVALEAESNPELHQDEALHAYSLAHEALVQLEMVAKVLRVLQDARPSHEVATAVTELAREAEETLRRMQSRAAGLVEDWSVPGLDTPAPAATPVPSPSPRPAIRDPALQRLADRYSPPELRELRTTLQDRLTRLGSADGLNALQGLVREYAQLRSMLAHRDDAGSLTLAHVPALAEEAYRQGLSVLGDALELIRATGGPQRQQLEQETAKLSEEIAALQGDDQRAARLKQLQARLASNQELLELIRRQRLRVEELLNQCRHCEISLDRTRIEMAGLRADSAESRVGEVTQTLRWTIDQAKEVQEELKQSGW